MKYVIQYEAVPGQWVVHYFRFRWTAQRQLLKTMARGLRVGTTEPVRVNSGGES